MNLPNELYVVVTEKDITDAQAALDPDHDVDSVVMETPVRLATKKHAGGLVRRSEANGLGKALIGRVVFFDTDQVKSGSVTMAELPSNEKLDEILRAINPAFDKMAAPEKPRQRFELLKWIKGL